MRGAVAKLAGLRLDLRDAPDRRARPHHAGADHDRPRTRAIAEAARTMKEHGASSLLVMDGEQLAGIVTDRDLRNRVLAVGRRCRSVRCSEVMTAGPVVGDADALAFEVLLEMVGRNIHHLPILEHDLPIGVVTTTDLMRMVQASPVYVVGDIQKQSDVEGVATVSARLPAVVEALVGQDASADDIGRVVTAIGDAVERRLITLAEAELGGPPVPYTWVALGSRARLEQALAADQDNAIIISDEATDADLAWFEELARRVSAGLVECGYPTCPGDVMATNPRWRLRLQDWRQEFATWLTQPVPDAILQASIFFDMRPVHGDSGLFPELHHGILARAPQSRLFLAHLAKAATLNEPPLGFFRGFVLAKEGEHADTLDIKRGGIGAVVELARVHALALGSPAVHTATRLQAAVAGGSHERGEGGRPHRRPRVHLLRPAAAPGGPGEGGAPGRQPRQPRPAQFLRQAPLA
jgi:CBS domain-containing protein